MEIASFYGVLVNTLGVISGSALGLIFRKGIPKKVSDAVMTAMGLCTMAIGIIGVVKSENQLVMVISIVLGVVIGTLIDIDGKLNILSDKVTAKIHIGNTTSASLSEGFITASLLFCIGAMTIVGSLNAGMSQDNELLYTKSVMDFISSIMLAASLGAGVIFSGVFVLLFEGLLVVLAVILGSFLSPQAISEIICAGSVMIIALGLNLTGITKIKVANLLPALLLVPFICLIISAFGV